MNHLVDLAEAGALLGRSVHTLRNGIISGALKPAVPGNCGPGRGSKFYTTQVLWMYLAEQLLLRGIGRKCFASFIDQAWAAKPDELEKAFKVGNTCLLVVGKNVQPHLANPARPIDPQLAAVALMNGIPTYFLNVESTYRNMLAKLEALRQPRPSYLPEPIPALN